MKSETEAETFKRVSQRVISPPEAVGGQRAFVCRPKGWPGKNV